jgi:hypothetical protein|tara:strand:+ start:286 stop:459 length:174 start_codon:yes stop_codon:yes gene_type:complete
MKIFLTKFIWDGEEFTGPNIYAKTQDEAEVIAEYYGCRVDGELLDVVATDSASERLH